MRISAAIGVLVLGSTLALDAQQAASLRIVVLEGEGAVNIIQQKTAVRPLVEVRDRNNLPVAGASVTFSIGGGGSGAAFAGGVQTLTVTTNAAGQAAASGLNALSSGAFQIQVQAAYQGQIATAAISQTNFATAAAAAQAGATAGGGTTTGAAGGAAGGGGGGISATTLGIVGAAVGGGALAATQVLGQSSSDDVYSGSVNGQLILTTVFTPTQGPQGTCTHTIAITGSITFELNDTGSSGTAKMEWNENDVAVAGGCDAGTARYSFTDAAVSGGPSALTFTFFLPGASGGVNQTTRTVTFNGSLSGGTIAGTVGIDRVQQGNPNGRGSTTIQVTAQR